MLCFSHNNWPHMQLIKVQKDSIKPW
jgi:hypothetical protein